MNDGNIGTSTKGHFVITNLYVPENSFTIHPTVPRNYEKAIDDIYEKFYELMKLGRYKESPADLLHFL